MPKIEDEVGDDLNASGFLADPGIYHMAVVQVDSPVLKADGSLADNAIFKVHCEVLAGSVPGMVGKSWSTTYYHPKQPASDKSVELKRKQRNRFWLAVNVISDAHKGKQVEIDTDDAVGEQLIGKLESSQDPKYLEFSGYGLDVYHVDDPQVAAFVKDYADKAALARIPANRRRISKQPAAPAKTDPPKSAAADKPAPKPATPGPDFSNL